MKIANDGDLSMAVARIGHLVRKSQRALNELDDLQDELIELRIAVHNFHNARRSRKR